MSEYQSQYLVGVVLSVTACPSATGNKPLKACRVQISEGSSDSITVVTAAANVREGSRLAVAPVGSKFVDETGEEIVVKKTSVGGVMSEGLFCDARMLGWIGGAEGVAAQIPDTVAIGVAPPDTKPRSDKAVSLEKEPDIPAVEVQPLFEKKLTKEEKKKLADEKRKAKKAAKGAQDAEDSPS